jgi:uncharacterized protein (DUF2141 family)
MMLTFGLCTQPVLALSNTSQLTVEVCGLESQSGKVMISLYDSKQSYEKSQNPVKKASLAIKGDKSLWLVKDLPPGEYAIKLFHDQNANQKLDRNFLGMPQEPYGFSNNARGFMGPPSFEEAKFNLEGKALLIKIQAQ